MSEISNKMTEASNIKEMKKAELENLKKVNFISIKISNCVLSSLLRKNI